MEVWAANLWKELGIAMAMAKLGQAMVFPSVVTGWQLAQVMVTL